MDTDINHEEEPSPRTFTRKEALKIAFGAGALFVAGELGLLSWLMAGEKKGQPNRMGTPDNTHLEGLPWGGYPWTKYDVPTLVRMNGNLNGLERLQNTKVIWAPGEVDGAYPVTKEALRFLQGHLVIRAVGEYDKELDSGWKSEDQEEIQNLSHLAVEQVSRFFGGKPLWVRGFVSIYRPGKDERKIIKQKFNMNDPRGGVFGNEGINGKNSLYIAMLLGDDWKGGLKQMSSEDRRFIQTTLAHEYAHGFIGPLQIPPFINHELVTLAGQSFYFDQLMEQNMYLKDPLLSNLATRLEAKTWLLIKNLTGEDFYAELLHKLFARYGTASLKFSQEQVMEMGEEIFQNANAPTSLKTIVENCPTGVCALDTECGPNYYCVNGTCVSKSEFNISNP